MAVGGIEGILGSYGTDMLNVYKTETESSSFEKSIENAADSGDEEQLMDACIEFESYFLKMMLSSMRNTIDTEDSFIPQSNGEKIFQSMLDEEYADKAAKSGNGIGLAKVLYKQLSANLKKPTVVDETEFD